MTYTLESLLGEHELSGAFFDALAEPAYKGGPDVEKQVIRFTLDGRNMEAVENPDDGYRSDLEEIRDCATAPLNQFPPVKVIGRMSDNPHDEILQFLNAATGKIIIEIGTSETDDYYPGFVALFSPENL